MAQIRPDDLDRLAEAVESMDASSDPHEFKRFDADFHEILYASFGNRTLSALMAAFWQVNTEIFIDFNDADPHVSAEAHRRIYKAVKGRQVDAAVNAMRDHFDPLRKELAEAVTIDAQLESQ